MKRVLLFGLVIALLTSVSANFYLISKNDRTKTTESLETLNFKLKRGCASYKESIEDRFERNNNGSPSEYYYFDKIFYSPLQNSCLYVYSGLFGIKASDRYRVQYLADALSGEILLTTVVIEAGKTKFEEQKAFQDVVAEYERTVPQPK